MNKLSIPFILSLFFYISPINAKVPKVVSKSAKALAKVVTYNKAGDLIGNSVAFFAGQSNEAYSEYEIFKNATRAEVIDASGKKIEVKRICGADEIYDVIKFTTETAPKQSLEIAEKAEVQGSKVYIISSAITKKTVTVEAEISDVKTVNGGSYYTLKSEYKEQYVGTPVLNAEGRVVGIVQRNADSNDKNIYAISADFASKLSVKALSYGDAALNVINIPKQLPTDEKEATTYLYMLSQTTADSLLYSIALNDFIEQHPQSADGYIERAKFYGSTNRFTECENDINRAIELSENKDNPHYVFSKIIYQNSLYNSTKAQAAGWSLERAVSEAQAAYAVNPLPIYQLQQGDCYFGMKDYAKAAEYYGQVNRSSISSPETFFYEAKAKENLKAPTDEIIVLLDSAIARFAKPYDKKVAPYLWERAELLNVAGKYREAVLDYKEYEHVVGFNNLNDNFYYRREQAAVEGKMYQQAIDDINRAIALKPNDYLYNVERASLMVRLGMFEEAIRSANKAIQLNNEGTDAYRIIGIAYGESKQKKLCIENLEKAVELGDEHAQELLDQYK